MGQYPFSVDSASIATWKATPTRYESLVRYAVIAVAVMLLLCVVAWRLLFATPKPAVVGDLVVSLPARNRGLQWNLSSYYMPELIVGVGEGHIPLEPLPDEISVGVSAILLARFDRRRKGILSSWQPASPALVSRDRRHLITVDGRSAPAVPLRLLRLPILGRLLRRKAAILRDGSRIQIGGYQLEYRDIGGQGDVLPY